MESLLGWGHIATRVLMHDLLGRMAGLMVLGWMPVHAWMVAIHRSLVWLLVHELLLRRLLRLVRRMGLGILSLLLSLLSCLHLHLLLSRHVLRLRLLMTVQSWVITVHRWLVLRSRMA